MSDINHKPVSPADYYRMSKNEPPLTEIKVDKLFSDITFYFNDAILSGDFRLKKKIVVDHFEDSRMWRVCTWWFDHKPFAVECVAGRPDYENNIITDRDVFSEAESYVRKLTADDIYVADPDEPCEGISCFYGKHIRDVVKIPD